MQINIDNTKQLLVLTLITALIGFTVTFFIVGAVLLPTIYGLEMPAPNDNNFISNHCYEKLSFNEIVLNDKGLSDTVFANNPFDFCGYMAQKFVENGWKLSEINTIDGQYK